MKVLHLLKFKYGITPMFMVIGKIQNNCILFLQRILRTVVEFNSLSYLKNI